ncbi:MAG TPA: glycosyltransferase family 39 protein [Tepidisphaeraceae bacterium]|nr:glycosyltransferase family 39 protein [Tepidisphaeraceae bacterium]
MSIVTRARRNYWIFLCAVILVTALFRAPWLTKHMLWTDEFFSLMFTNGQLTDVVPPNEIVTAPPDVVGLRDAVPIADLPRIMRADTHPPLFPIALRLWREVVGESELSARLFMLGWSLVGVGFLFDAIHRQVGLRTAVATGLLFAASAPMVSYGVEIRNYGIMTALIICAANALIRIELSGYNIQRVVAFSAASLAALLTHYFALAPIVGLGLYATVRLKGRSRVAIAGSLAVAALLFCIIQLQSFFAQRSHFDSNLEYLADRTANPIFNTFLRALCLPGRALTFDVLNNQRALALGIVLVIIIWLRRTKPMLIWATLALATIGQCVTIDLIQQRVATNFIRYTLPATAAILALLALAAGSFKKWSFASFLIFLIGLGTFASIRTMNHPLRPRWNTLFDRMKVEQLSRSDIVVFVRDPNNSWPTQVRYAAFCSEIGPPISQVVFLDKDRPLDFDPAARVYIITSDWSRPRVADHNFLWRIRGDQMGSIYAFGPQP